MLKRLWQADLFTTCHMQDLSSKPAVAQQRADMVIGGEKPLPLLFPVESGTLRVQGGVDGVRIVVKSRVARIE